MRLDSASLSKPGEVLDHQIYRLKVSQRIGAEGVLRRFLFVLVGLGLFIFLIFPLILALVRSFQNRAREFVGLSNYIAYFASPASSASLRNSLYISVVSTILTLLITFIFAYGITRMTFPWRGPFRQIAQLPIFLPSLVQALAFIYMFGNNGVFTRLFHYNIHLYGKVGIIMSEVFYAFPHALIILSTALSLSDARLYEAAESLRTSSWRTFWTITIPNIRYGLLSAAFVVFTLAITDFGAPKVVGGNYNVLATDIYDKVVGQQNFEMGATISTLLLIPALLVFILDRWVQRKQVAQVTANIVPLPPKKHSPFLQTSVFIFCILVSILILSVYAIVTVGAFTKYWPYNLGLTLKNFTFYVAGIQHKYGVFVILWNSIKMASMTALFGTVIVFISAFLIEKSRGLYLPRSLLYFLSVMPLAIPGMVKGLSYIFAFNDPRNPFYFLYGTMAILVISTILHYYTVPFLTATTALKQMDPEFESTGESLGTPFFRTFTKVTVPLAMPAILQIAMYFFLNAMVTLSAVVFIFVPGKELAALSVMLLDDAGETAQAMAMSLLIIVVGFIARGLFYIATRGLEKSTQAWRKR